MTFDIDEATDFCKHKSSNYKRMSVDAGTMDLKPEEARFEEECKRYEQLAEWLTELKEAREELAEWYKLKLIYACEGIVVYKVKENDK